MRADPSGLQLKLLRVADRSRWDAYVRCCPNATFFHLSGWQRVIEEALYEHPAILEAVVIGVFDDYRGQAPKAFVTLRPGESATPSELRDFLVDKVSKIELPREVEIRQTLPRTLIGKLSKKELKEEMQVKTREAQQQPGA